MAEKVLGGGKTPRLRKARAGEWTKAKRDGFLDELAATCNVEASLRKVRMSRAGVYKLRRRCARFRAEWAEALREGYAKLELMLLDRAMNGTVKTVTRADGSVDKTHEYPNGVALALLRMHRASAVETETEHHPDHIEEVRRRIMRKLAAVKKKMDKEKAAGGSVAGTSSPAEA